MLKIVTEHAVVIKLEIGGYILPLIPLEVSHPDNITGIYVKDTCQ